MIDKKKNILLVEDEIILAMSEKQTLEEEGFEVVLLSDGESAVDIVDTSEEMPDLILMDIVLGKGMDGITAARKILEKTNIPVVFLSSNADESVIEKTREITSYGVISKGTGISVLTAFINMAIRLHGAHRELLEKEAALKESNEKYLSVFNNSLDAVLLTVPDDGNVIAANKEACRIFGRSEEEICRVGRAGLLDVSDPRLEGLLKERTMKGRARGELTFIRKDGSRFPGEISSSVFMDTLGNRRTSMTIRDITDRVRTEKDLMMAKARLQHLLTASPAVIYSSIPSCYFKVTYISENIVNLLGFSVEDVMGDHMFWPGHIHPDDLPKIVGFFSDPGRVDRHLFEYRILNSDNEYIWIQDEIDVIRDTEGNPVELVGCLLDINKRKQMENELRESNIMYRVLVEHVPGIISRFDREIRHMYVSPSITDVTGLSPEAYIGRTNLELGMPESLVKRWDAAIKKVFDTGSEVRLEFDYPRSDETYIYEARLVPEFTEDLSVKTVLAITFDITKRKQAQEEVKRLNKSILGLQEKERQRVARDLHDSISQTLLAARFNIETYKMDPFKYSDRLDIVVNLLDKAKYELKEICSGLFPSILRDFGLVTTIEWLAHHVLEEKNLTVEFLHDLKKTISHDLEVNLYRIVQEIFSNILKHSNCSEVSIDLRDEEEYILLSVSDNGTGFDPNDESLKKSGQGLSNIKSRAENYSGTCDILSSSEYGTIIKIRVRE